MTLAAAIPLVAGLAGCGGGGGGIPTDVSKEVPGSTPSSPAATPITPVPTPANPVAIASPAPVTKSFLPNYRAELIAARRWNQSVVTVGFTAPVDAAGAIRNVGPLVQQAVDMWNRKVNQDISFQMTDSPDADVQIKWVAAGTLPSDAIGRTEVKFRNADQVLIAASVSIERSLPDAFQVQVITHELGHSLGIEGHSTLPSDLMYANAHLPAEITTRDQNTILQAYDSAASRSIKPVSGIPDSSTTTVQYVCGYGELAAHHIHSQH